MSNSILDTIKQSNQINNLTSFDFHQLLSEILRVLSEREKEIIEKRFALNGQKRKETLEKIGEVNNITRERVRQIQSASLNKLKNENKDRLTDMGKLIFDILEANGGIMEQEHLVDSLLVYSSNSEFSRKVIKFIVQNLLDDYIKTIPRHSNFLPHFKTESADYLKTDDNLDRIIKFFETENKPHKEEELFEIFEDIDNNLIQAYLYLSRYLDKNIFNQWGKSDWSSIRPRRMHDKILLVLRDYKKPLHFEEIAELINKSNFDGKRAYPATVHNELILNKDYILIGRGIYALREWGYKEGIVSDVVEDIIKNAKNPMTKDEIVEEVLKKRFVKKSTVYLALMDKSKFKKEPNGTFSLVV